MATKAMTRAELASNVASEAGVSVKDANAAISALSAVITATVASGGAVTLPGIGKIESRERAARNVRNPQTGETIRKPADRAPRMVFAKALKTACNG